MDDTDRATTRALAANAIDPEWYDAIRTRTSRRRYDGAPVAPDILGKLHALTVRFRPSPAARIAVVDTAPPELFTGLVGSYGGVKGAPSAGLIIATEGGRVDAGYAGEALILEATRLGLGTCWLAGMFGKKRAQTLTDLAPGESVVAVTPIGRATEKLSGTERAMRGAARSSNRKPLEELAPGVTTESWPAWAMTALEAARLAPSGANGQPWRFRLEDGALVLSTAKGVYWTAPFDFGIAMLHVELGALKAGVAGAWERELAEPDIARFVPDAGEVPS